MWKNALHVWGSAIKFGTIDQDDLLRGFSNIVIEWYVISVLESNNEEPWLIWDALDTLYSNLILIMLWSDIPTEEQPTILLILQYML